MMMMATIMKLLMMSVLLIEKVNILPMLMVKRAANFCRPAAHHTSQSAQHIVPAVAAIL